jgi:hypothetical protein
MDSKKKIEIDSPYVTVTVEGSFAKTDPQPSVGVAASRTLRGRYSETRKMSPVGNRLS